MKRKIVLCGCQKFGITLIEALIEANISISYIVTITPEKAIQQNVAGYVDYSVISERLEIPIYFADKYSLKANRDKDFFNIQNFDLLIQGGWQRLFPDYVLNSLTIGAIGVHGSSDYLPKGRGRSPINWSIIEGKSRFIFHFFMMKSGVDDGNIFHIESVDVNHWDDCETIYLKNVMVTSKAIIENLDKLYDNKILSYKQIGKPSYYPKRSADDGRIDFTKDLIEIHNFIRALTRPYPGAYAFIGNRKINIWRAQPFDTRIDEIYHKIGQVVYVEKDRFIFKTLGGLLLVTDYEIENGFKINKTDLIE